MPHTLENYLGRIHQIDCVAGMQELPLESVELVFADPPFNIGYDYDVYEDRLEYEKYLSWSREWIGGVHRILKPDGAFWLAIGDEYAAELKLESRKLGFHCRSWIVWYYTFGVHCKTKFTRSHAHLFHFVKNPKKFTFNRAAIAVPSARQLVYRDSRADPAGRTPDDTWILRPQDIPDSFTPDEDTWYFPRVNGTFKERAGFHGCQMPEQLLGRIVRACSHEGDIVFDPFSGSSTTIAVAKKLNRKYFSFELSEEYVQRGTARLAAIQVGDPLEGAAEPTVSAPSTAAATKRSRSDENLIGFRSGLNFDGLKGDIQGLLEAYSKCSEGYSVDRLVADPILNQDFQIACDRTGVQGTAAERNRQLFTLRKAGKLKSIGVETTQRTTFSWEHLTQFIFGSEIAWRRLSNDYKGYSLDDILCDPLLAAEFDQLASKFAPGFRSIEYRWGAIYLRKVAKSLKVQIGRTLVRVPGRNSWVTDVSLADLFDKNLPNKPGVYAISDSDSHYLYASETNSLRDRLSRHFSETSRTEWTKQSSRTVSIKYAILDAPIDSRLTYHGLLVKKYEPEWNMVQTLVA